MSWTITHEEIFREPREWFSKHAESKSLVVRKIFYPFTCEYCFSHYVTALILVITKYSLYFQDWRGYVLAGFAIVWIANTYMSVFQLIRVNIKLTNLKAKELE